MLNNLWLDFHGKILISFTWRARDSDWENHRTKEETTKSSIIVFNVEGNRLFLFLLLNNMGITTVIYWKFYETFNDFNRFLSKQQQQFRVPFFCLEISVIHGLKFTFAHAMFIFSVKCNCFIFKAGAISQHELCLCISFSFFLTGSRLFSLRPMI